MQSIEKFDEEHHQTTVHDSLNLNKCDSDNSSFFNPLPHEPENSLLGTSNDPLPNIGSDFRSDPPGPYSTNQVAYQFNMA